MDVSDARDKRGLRGTEGHVLKACCRVDGPCLSSGMLLVRVIRENSSIYCSMSTSTMRAWSRRTQGKDCNASRTVPHVGQSVTHTQPPANVVSRTGERRQIVQETDGQSLFLCVSGDRRGEERQRC